MKFCGLPWKFKKQNSSSSPVKTVRTDMRWKYSSDLKSYESACQEVEKLKSFDSTLHQQTDRFIKSLNSHTKTDKSVSLDSLMEVYGFLSNVNETAVNLIIESKEDVWKNKKVRALVEAYFNSTSKTLDLCNTIDKCVKKTENGQLVIRSAMKQFEAESVETDLGEIGKKKYSKTLEELNEFKAMGDPFNGEFITQYESVYAEKLQLLKELHKQKRKLDKEEKKSEVFKTLSNVLFATVFVSVLVLSVVLASITAPPIVPAIVAGSTPVIEVTGKWLSKKSKEIEKAIKRQKGLVKEIDKAIELDKNEMASVIKEVDNVRNMISSFQETVKFALEREEEEVAIGFAMEKIKKEVDGFTEKIKKLGEYTIKYCFNISRGRDVVLNYIRALPAN